MSKVFNHAQVFRKLHVDKIKIANKEADVGDFATETDV